MLDTHCHLDRYADAYDVASRANRDGVFVIAVTNLPSHFEIGRHHVANLRRVRLALGLHPLAAEQHALEKEQFERLLSSTSFVGEVGLDFSREGKATAEIQSESFRFVARLISNSPKFVTLHSRGAEQETLSILNEFRLGPCVFHWYSGSMSVLDDVLSAGHYLSLNPAMIETEKGKRIIARLPRERVLTESDGPFVSIRGMPVEPSAVQVVEQFLSVSWQVHHSTVRQTVWANFRHILAGLGLLGAQ